MLKWLGGSAIKTLAAAGMIAAGLGMASVADAAPIITFGQHGGGNPVVATVDKGERQTTITALNTEVDVTQYPGRDAPFRGYFNLDIASTGEATFTRAGNLEQAFSGRASITSEMGGTGVNYLSAIFDSYVFGIRDGDALTLIASEPSSMVTFLSDLIPASQLSSPRAFGLAFADVGGVKQQYGTLGEFTATVAGTVSAQDVPEPASLALLGAGLFGLVMTRRRQSQMAA